MIHQDLPFEDLNVPTKTIDQSKLDLDINDFYDNDIIIISSGTATGKTRNIAKLSKQLKEKYNCKILSIVNLISLAREQINTFNEISKITLKDYQTELNGFYSGDGVICANSLYKLGILEDEYETDNVILYIDEVNDLIRTMTHNNSLDSVLIPVYNYLLTLIKNCKKIILSDATINQNTLNLLSSRTKDRKTLLIKNVNKKFNGIEAIRYHDEDNFLEELRNHIKQKKYFLFGCDQCRKVTEIFVNIIKDFDDQKDNFILLKLILKY